MHPPLPSLLAAALFPSLLYGPPQLLVIRIYLPACLLLEPCPAGKSVALIHKSNNSVQASHSPAMKIILVVAFLALVGCVAAQPFEFQGSFAPRLGEPNQRKAANYTGEHLSDALTMVYKPFECYLPCLFT